MPRYDSTSTSEIISKAEDLVIQLDDICALDIDAVNVDPEDYNKLHDTVNTNAQKMKLLQEMQKLRMQCASYQRQIMTLKYQMEQVNVDKNQYHHLRKECISNKQTRAQQRKVISRLYTQINQYKQKDAKLKHEIKELKHANKEWIHRYQSISQNEKKYKRKSIQYQQKLQQLVNNQWNANHDEKEMISANNSNEKAKIIEVLQSQLKTKNLETIAMKRILIKYKNLIHDNNKNLNELTDKIHYLQNKKNPPKPIMHNKTIQTVSQTRNKKKFGQSQQENMNPNTMHQRRQQKRQHLNKWINTIHNAPSLNTTDSKTHGSIADMLHDLKLQILERKLMYN